MAFVFTSHRKEVLDAVQGAVDRALEICGGKAEGYAVDLAPVKTGNLKNSITHEQESNDTEVIGSTVFYAPYVELGHHQEPGRYVPAIKKRLVRSFVPGKQFIRPAIMNHVDEYKEVFEGELKKVSG